MVPRMRSSPADSSSATVRITSPLMTVSVLAIVHP